MLRLMVIAVLWYAALSAALGSAALVWAVPPAAVTVPALLGAGSVTLAVALHRRRQLEARGARHTAIGPRASGVQRLGGRAA